MVTASVGLTNGISSAENLEIMKIQLASDLHLEFLNRDFPTARLISPAHDADVLVLAGDIANGTDAIALFKDWPVPVLYLAGNHEFYARDFEATRVALREASRGTVVRFLDNDVADFGSVRFLGTTIWTDYRLEYSLTQLKAMNIAEEAINDHRRIRCENGPFRPERALAEHEQARSWLAEELSKPYEGRTVVVTHHGPHPNSVHPRYEGSPVNPAFNSDLWAAAGSVDTDLSFLSFLKVYRTDVAQRRMPARRVVEPLDVVKDICSGLLPGAVHLSGCALRLQ